MVYKNFNIPNVKVATGLYSQLDSIIKFNKNALNWTKKHKEKKPKNIVLNSIEEVIYTLKNSIKNGDNESLISKEVYNKLDKLFPKREIRTGGNGNNMGKILLNLGLNPIVSYPIRPEKLMKISPNFKVACGNGFKLPKEAIRKNDPDYEHIIFESEGWRNILSWDLMTSQGIFDEDFLRFAFIQEFTDIAIISYAHLLLPKYKKRTDFLLDFIKKNRPKIHLEFGVGCEDSMKYAMERFSENEACDSWGLNEKECKIYFKAGSENIKDLMEATLEAIKEYNLKRICVHSSKFAFSFSKYDIKREIEALEAGCFAAANSSNKISQKNNILNQKLDNYNFCLVHSFFNPKMRKITGLGDAFAAVQAVKILS